MTLPTFTTPTAAPDPTDSESVFNAKVENRLAWQATNITELQTFVTWAAELSSNVESSETATIAARTATETAREETQNLKNQTQTLRDEAVAANDAVLWTTGQDWAQAAAAISPSTLRTYRARSALMGSTIDPALDPDNWLIMDLSYLPGFDAEVSGTFVDVALARLSDMTDGGASVRNATNTSWHRDWGAWPEEFAIGYTRAALTVYDATGGQLVEYGSFPASHSFTSGNAIGLGTNVNVAPSSVHFCEGHIILGVDGQGSDGALIVLDLCEDVSVMWGRSAGVRRYKSTLTTTGAGFKLSNYSARLNPANESGAERVKSVFGQALPGTVDRFGRQKIKVAATHNNGANVVYRPVDLDAVCFGFGTSDGDMSYVAFDADGGLWVSGGEGVAWRSRYYSDTSSSTNVEDILVEEDSDSVPKKGTDASTTPRGIGIDPATNEAYLAWSSGFQIVPQNGKWTAHMDRNYATGVLHAGTQLALFCDDATETYVGTELVTNGDFASGTSGWTANSSSLAVSSGELEVTISAGQVLGGAYQDLTVEVGESYVISCDARVGTSAAAFLWAYAGGSFGSKYSAEDSTTGSSAGPLSITVTATNTTLRVYLRTTDGPSETAYFDNVSVRKAVVDYSRFGHGAAIHGTLTNAAVATGADLGAVRGFTETGNYVQQPYNSRLDYGTGDFFVQWWQKSEDDYYVLADRRGSDTAQGWMAYMNTDEFQLRLSGSSFVIPLEDIDSDRWELYTAVRDGDDVRLYRNDRLVGTASGAAAATANSSVNPPLKIGANFSGTTGLNYGGTSYLRWFKTGEGAPTQADIARQYALELPLLRPNAQGLAPDIGNRFAACFDPVTSKFHMGGQTGSYATRGLGVVSTDADHTTTVAIATLNDTVISE